MSRFPFQDDEELNAEDFVDNGDISEEELLQVAPSVDDRNPAALKYFTKNTELPETGLELPPNTLVGQKFNAQPKDEDLESLLKDFDSLTKPKNELADIQKSVNAKNKDLNYLMAGNKIAQSIASGYGGKIGDNSEGVKMLMDQNDSQITDYKDRIKDRMDDPSSDVSKFYRYQVMKNIKTQDPNADVSAFDNMSANELKDIISNNLKGNGRNDLFFTSIKDENGKDIVAAFDRKTGQRVTTLGDRSLADRIIVNPETKQQEVYNQVTGLKPVRNDSLKQEQGKDVQTVNNEYQEILNSPTSLAKTNPKLYDNFKKDQEQFLKSVEENRNVATGATTLASKLKPGKNSEIDSGLLGGIQTQAAKMAGQKGVLTDQDLVKFAGAGGILPAIERIANGSFFGDMSDTDVKFFKRFSELMQQSNAKDIDDRSKFFIDKTHNEAKNYIPGLSKENVKSWLNVDSVAPAGQTQSSEIKRKTSDGKIAIFDAKTKKFLRYEK